MGKVWAPAIAAAVVFAALFTGACAQTEPAGADEMVVRQRALIEVFSGETALPSGKKLRSRFSGEQRARAARFLAEEMKARGLDTKLHEYRTPQNYQTTDFRLLPSKGVNVVAELPATIEKAPTVIVGAHYDTVRGSPGANDNATGVAAVLEIAAALRQLDERHYRFLFVFFDQEEDDSLGSRAFVRQLVEDSVDVHSMHNVDLFGWDGDGDRVIELDVPTDELKAHYVAAAENLDVDLSFVRYNTSDHVVFRKAGFDAVCMGEEIGGGDYSPYYHTRKDKIDYVDFAYLAHGTRFMTAALVSLAAN